MSETITYEIIRKIQREETLSPSLTKLPQNFFEEVKNYLEIKKSMKDTKSLFEVKNVEILLKSILKLRERKILKAVVEFFDSGVVPENMEPDEREMFNKMVELLKERRNKILKFKPEKQKVLIAKEEIPEFVGTDEKTYGPFKKGDILKLPEDIMEILVEQGLAEEVEVEE
jgi:DNA replication initiation complex subunit (GINS family)